jgi:sulfotransferase 6B1
MSTRVAETKTPRRVASVVRLKAAPAADTTRAVQRKLRAFGRQVPRVAAFARAELHLVERRPAVIVDSFPKSGTHLLSQVVAALPGAVDYGRFVATVPSIRHVPRPYNNVRRRLSGLAPGEIVRTHLLYDEKVGGLLEAQNALHLFIYRDPRDVVVSEAHYLAEMAPWHALHASFKALPDLDSRIRLSIQGSSSLSDEIWYPNIAERFAAYEGWLADSNVFTIRFEELVANQESCGSGIAAAYAERADEPADEPAFLSRMLAHVDPAKSHTYRRGGSGGWREAFTDQHRDAMKQVAGDLLVRLGYESNLDW